MADGRPRARAGRRRSGRQPAAGETASDPVKEKNSGRSTLVKQRPTALPDLDDDTPRVMLRRIIQTQPQVSPLAPLVSAREETEEARSELPAKRASSTMGCSRQRAFLWLVVLAQLSHGPSAALNRSWEGEMKLPDLPPEKTSITMFRMGKKRRKLSVSEFERAADKRLPQNQAQTTLDSTALARSLRMSLGSLIPPDTVEKRGLLRRPKNRKAIDVEAFEGGVEQNMLKRRAQDYLVNSQTASGIGTAMLASDAEIVLSNTELFVQPQGGEQSQPKLSALEAQLSESRTSAWRSHVSDAAQEDARLAGLVSSVGTSEGTSRRYSEDLIPDREHVDRVTHVSPKTPADQPEDEQDRSPQSNLMKQLSVAEKVVAGTVDRWSSSLPSRRSSKSLGSPVTLKPKRSFSMSLREVVSRIIEDLDVSGAEEEMANAVSRVEQEMSREATEHHANAGYSEHLGKTPVKMAESQITVAQGERVETETAPSGEEGPEEGEEGPEGPSAEGGAGHQGSPGADLEHETAKGGGAGSLGRRFLAFSSPENSGMRPSKEAVERAGELEDEAVVVEGEALEEETSEEGEEDPESEEVSMKTPAFVRAAACEPLLLTPRSAPASSAPRPAKATAPKPAAPWQPLRARLAPKSSAASRRRTPREPGVASSLIRKIFSHYVKMPVSRDAFKIVEKCSERYFKQLSNDLEAYTNHAGRKTVEMADLEILMRRQGLVTDKMPLHVLIERHLPLEYRKLLIPVATSGNKVIPCK